LVVFLQKKNRLPAMRGDKLDHPVRCDLARGGFADRVA
jgi:hypothetical protein